MQKSCVPLVSYAVQSKGPLLSGLMLDNGLALLAAHLKSSGHVPVIFDYNSVGAVETIAQVGSQGMRDKATVELSKFIRDHDVKTLGFKLYVNGFADSVQIAHDLRKAHRSLRIV